MRKFIETYSVDDYEILTDIGFIDVKNIMLTIPYETYELITQDGTVMYCADTHKLIDTLDNEINACDSLGKLIKVNGGTTKIISVTNTLKYKNMYDVELVSHHKYYTNNILSHNTTVVAAYLTHLAIFNPDYNIALLANKKAQAEEILDRIKLMYRSLPWWLQPGIKRWNVRDIHITLGEKGTSVFTESTAGSSIRGKTVNCLGGNTLLHLRHIDTKEEFTINIERLYEILNDKEKLYSDDT